MTDRRSTVRFPLGLVVVRTGSRGVCSVGFDLDGAAEEATGDGEVERQIGEYLAGRRRDLDLPLELPDGPPFFRRAWEAARRVPYGTTVTYGRLAALAGSPRAARAAGQAMAANPVPLLVPCHRVVAGRGAGGFSSGPEVKRWLLDLERRGLEGPPPEGALGQGCGRGHGGGLHRARAPGPPRRGPR